MKIFFFFKKKMESSLLDNNSRKYIKLLGGYGIALAISLVVTILNIFTNQFFFTLITFSFAVFCAFIFFMLKKEKVNLNLAEILFIILVYLLFVYFIISGTSEAFSILWICILPSYSLFLFGKKRGTVISLGMFLLIFFFFQTDLGISLLNHNYSNMFNFSISFLYWTFFVISFLLESIHSFTYNELIKAQKQYYYLYHHDPLTKVYNRHRFNQIIDKHLSKKEGSLSLMIINIDNFRQINNKYGYTKSDAILIFLAKIIKDIISSQGNIGRWTGESFAVVLDKTNGTLQIANEVCTAIRKNDFIVPVNISIGAVKANNLEIVTFSQLINMTDFYLYRAKELGSNRVEYAEI